MDVFSEMRQLCANILSDFVDDSETGLPKALLKSIAEDIQTCVESVPSHAMIFVSLTLTFSLSLFAAFSLSL